MLVLLTGTYDSAERELTTTGKVGDKEHSPAVSSHYGSAESDADDSDYMEIKRMSLNSGAALLRDHHEHTAPTTVAMGSFITKVSAMDESDQIQFYFAKSMEKFLLDQHRHLPRMAQNGRPTPNHNVSGALCWAPKW